MRRAGHSAALQVVHRHDSEVEQQHLQQIFARDERIGHERGERLAIEPLEHSLAQRGLARADVAGQHDQALAAANREKEILERAGMRGAAVQEPGIGREAEGLFSKTVERLVGHQRRRHRRRLGKRIQRGKFVHQSTRR
jgi:hypothetical protein